MEIKIARKELGAKPQVLSFNKLLDDAKIDGQKIHYFDKDNSHKDMMDLVDMFEDGGFNVYFREVKFGLDEHDYMYEVHVIQN